MIIILYAIKNELNYFKRNLKKIEEYQIENSTFFETELNNEPIVLVQTGVGTKNSKAAIEEVLNNYDSKLIISTGYTGALKDGIEVGDIVFANNFLYSENLIETGNETAFQNINVINKEIYVKLIKDVCRNNGLLLHSGDILTVDKVVSNSSDKKKIGCKTTAVVVDMETYAIAEAISNKKIDFLSIRVVSDDVNCSFDVDKISEIAEDGTVDIKKTGVKILKNLNYVPQLMKLRKQAIIASRNINKLLYNFLSNLKNERNECIA